MENDDRYMRAKKRVENLKGFYLHLTTYVLVNAFIFGINLMTSAGEWWFFYPLLGWGVGLFIHGLTVFASGKFGDEWEERKIREYMEKDKRE